MQITKKAIQNLNNKKLELENKRLQIISNLNENDQFNKAYLERRNLIIEKAKAEFNNEQFDNEKILNCEKILKKHLSRYNKSNPLELLSPAIMCNKCNDKHYINGDACSCLKSELTDILRNESGLTSFAKFKDSNFSLFKQSDKTCKIYTMLEKWCDKPFGNKFVNFGFFGHTGTGKTFLMQCMADKLIDNGHFVYFTTAFNLHKNLLQYHTDNNTELLQRFIVCDILFIDDLGTENFIKNITENYLYTIINQRMINNKPTIFSTNLDLNGFFERYGERIFSRLVNKSNSKVFWFDDEDLRLKNK